ncbi:bifunctional 2-C-methyl-D-erythritol 4-phosphate cytidylyltransferase/2-C-methyl-D-erythritol 2,4-cyclodiphosphate synthase [Sphingorhabdus soli]|uniref:Bifunctional enzyme IspD/IspF n=1 Tax=Flavisphingopyxis soli TaxID=2601267 RepID=A0A5C6U8J7_9SPHN|nr:bifunctional 2-C-methyl-D-erythritol 4-phosphate cytidylyltransferase/2-C-methyl-D-erythritol 2,4-cyclodiphosphate synthase [Sphingorhabdus soli]TXC69182.1 bifunctional 2-C-methyl-D-erythritol 4-phosphate cytidylyltransferase/2-C-methyl-D-erythritol 2,4-cyclodiphosphate synthase [Sphingorhabdus soli]
MTAPITIPSIAAIVLAAGKGVRAGGSAPKQFARLAGKPVLRWSVETLARDPRIGSVVVVTHPDNRDDAVTILEGIPGLTFADGGATRRESVASGLAAIDGDLVMVHDAARPLLPVRVLDRLIAAMDDGELAGAAPALPIADTLAERDNAALGAVVDRGALVRIQTPQIFRTDALMAAHRDWQGEEPTDDAQMVRQGGESVGIVKGAAMLDKITWPDDLARLAAQVGANRRIATGMGFDVHRLVAGEELWLGGVQIAHDRGLAGHSDADVALHALTDAILGAIGAGDIGVHFPPSDQQWRGARSDRFLKHAGDLVAAANGAIQSIDLTIICEEPKIGPYREAMRIRIAEILEMSVTQVSVKATTTEGLGYAGRGEGIAAQAIATLQITEPPI